MQAPGVGRGWAGSTSEGTGHKQHSPDQTRLALPRALASTWQAGETSECSKKLSDSNRNVSSCSFLLQYCFKLIFSYF